MTPTNIQGELTFNLNIEVFTEDEKWEKAVVFKIESSFIGYINIQNNLEVFLDIGNSYILFFLSQFLSSKVIKNTKILRAVSSL